jgi:cell filamentation protein
MKQRLLVMNGQLLVQIEQAGEWNTDRVEKSGNLKPGIYAIYLATVADKKKVYDGPIVHIDKHGLYQQVGKSFVLHEHEDFQKNPELGANLNVSYESGKCVAISSTRRSGRKIS